MVTGCGKDTTYTARHLLLPEESNLEANAAMQRETPVSDVKHEKYQPNSNLRISYQLYTCPLQLQLFTIAYIEIHWIYILESRPSGLVFTISVIYMILPQCA